MLKNLRALSCQREKSGVVAGDDELLEVAAVPKGWQLGSLYDVGPSVIARRYSCVVVRRDLAP
jgi:hypothetical protein